MPQRQIRGYYTYFYGDSHEEMEDRPPIPVAEPLDDPLHVDPETRTRYFRDNIYPYAKRMTYEEYYEHKFPLQVELVRMQDWVKETGQRLIILFEGRDAAGKGGTIRRFMEHWNPRNARVVALAKPSDSERGQWYFQRYVRHFPTEGEIVLFDRSWYNRAGVERVLGFTDEGRYRLFLRQAPLLERMIVESGIHLTKLYFSVSREEQIRRFEQRDQDPLKRWKLTPTDLLSKDRWDDYTAAKETMFRETHTAAAPWTIIKSDDKMRGRINAMRYVLNILDYEGKDPSVAHAPDPSIVAPAGDIYPVRAAAREPSVV